MNNLSNRLSAFIRQLNLNLPLPAGVSVMNPYAESPLALRLADTFYKKFYDDDQERQLILGINPGRFGAALSGVPFTDFKRLEMHCGISAAGHSAHEPSSEFVYRMIIAQGTVEAFYKRFLISSVCPLGFTIRNAAGRDVNYNYYDDPGLFETLRPFILKSLHQHIGLGCSPRRVFCMGIRNAGMLRRINDTEQLFDEIVALPHPRYIMQYRRAHLEAEIDNYRKLLG